MTLTVLTAVIGLVVIFFVAKIAFKLFKSMLKAIFAAGILFVILGLWVAYSLWTFK